jgi:hypothetical protein
MVSDPKTRSYLHPSRKCHHLSGRFFSYFQDKSFLKVTIAGILCLIVPVHQIPSRRLLLQTLLHYKEVSNQAVRKTKSGNSCKFQKIQRNFQRSRFCTVKKEKFRVQEYTSTSAESIPNNGKNLRFPLFVPSKLIRSSILLISLPSRSPPSYF